MKTLLAATSFISILIMLVVGIWLVGNAPGKFKVVFLDVGQGDAIFIQTPDRYQVLVDTGIGKSVVSELGSVMRPWDRSLDLVVITHPDADHYGALADVFGQYAVDRVIDNGFYFHPDFADYRDLIETEGSAHTRPVDGHTIRTTDDTLFTFISVPAYGTHDDKNEDSIIMRIDHDDASFLLTGDAGIEIEQQLAFGVPELLDVDVLKLGHHGSKTSTSELFLRMTTPSMAVVSAGEDNRYGHPHTSVTDLLEKHDIPVVCTCEGRVGFVWDEKEGVLATR